MSDFSNKVVIVTGASSGIGAACALKFAAAAAKLVLVGRNVENLSGVAAQCEQTSGMKPLEVVADISVDEDVERIVSEAVRHHGRIDVLVNNAGIYLNAGILDGIATFDKIMATNLRGTYQLTSRVVPHLIESKGNIVNISSMLSTKPKGILVPYCMSKAALDMFTQATALELGPKGVRVNAVNPGPINTELFKRGGLEAAANDKLFEYFEQVSPLQRVAGAGDVAEVVCFLASARAACVTGCLHVVDCGLSLGHIGSF